MKYEIEEPLFDEHTERLINQFEIACYSGAEFDVRSAIIGLSIAQRNALLCELACIDLEFKLNAQSESQFSAAKSPSPFLAQFPDVFALPSIREQVAREHYRLCHYQGLSLTSDEIGKLYNVGSSDWPQYGACTDLPRIADSKLLVDSKGVPPFPEISSTFCGYELVSELGRGALSRVYLARQPDLERRLVALKVSRRLTTEANQLAKLQHAGIIAIYSIHEQDGLYAICMPYRGAVTLGDFLRNSATLHEQADAKRIASQALISTLVSQRTSIILANSVTESTRHRLSNHPSPSLYDDVESGTNHSISTGCLGLESLADSLQSKYDSQSPMFSEVKLAADIAIAVAYAHERGIVHRDLKPDNILLSNDGTPVVLDFNLAMDTACHAELIGGTLPYMSPQHLEAVLGTGECSAADDVYALGVILFELLCNRHPFPERLGAVDLQHEEARQLWQQPPPSLRQFNAAIPSSLQNVVLKCLAFQRCDRYASAKELWEDLDASLNYRPLRHALDTDWLERVGKLTKRHPVMMSTTSLSFVALSIFLVLGTFIWTGKATENRLLAEQQAERLVQLLPEIRAELASPGLEPDLLKPGVTSGRQILDDWHVSPAGFDEASPYHLLNEEERARVAVRLADLATGMAVAEERLRRMDLQLPEGAEHWLKIAATLQPQAPPRPGGWDAFYLEEDAAQRAFALQQALLEAELECVDQPHDPSSWFSLGSLHFMRGNYELACHAYDVSAKLQAGSAASVFWRGVSRLRLQQYLAAEADFAECLELRPSWLAARFNLVLSMYGAGQNEAALDEANHLVAQGERTPRVLSLRSKLQARLGHPTEANADLETALTLLPKLPEDWVAQGVLLIRRDPSGAIERFSTALELDPDQYSALQNIAHVQAEVMRDTMGAIASMDKLIALQPTTAAFASRGILHARLSHREQALADARNASERSPRPLEMLQIAGIYALCAAASDDETRASSIHWLALAVSMQPDLAAIAIGDSDLANLRTHPLFEVIVANAAAH